MRTTLANHTWAWTHTHCTCKPPIDYKHGYHDCVLVFTLKVGLYRSTYIQHKDTMAWPIRCTLSDTLLSDIWKRHYIGLYVYSHNHLYLYRTVRQFISPAINMSPGVDENTICSACLSNDKCLCALDVNFHRWWLHFPRTTFPLNEGALPIRLY